jgi:predicted kinase
MDSHDLARAGEERLIMASTLYLIRGLPGSGKSSLAHRLTSAVCEADQYFMEGDDYRFDPRELPRAHASCLAKVRLLMEGSIGEIAVANTFIKRDHLIPYFELAAAYRYETQIIHVSTRLDAAGLASRSIHHVPIGVIKRMMTEWEEVVR